MVLLRSLVLWGYFLLSLPVLWLVGVLIFLTTLPFDRRRRLLHAFTCWWGGHYARLVPFWDIQVRGVEHIDRQGVYVLASNHQSAVDIMVLFNLHRHFKWIAKREAFKLPFIGWNMWMNDYVALRRGDSGSIARMMEDSRKHLQRGSSIMIFPEGTRTRDGKLRKFKHGAFSLACDADVPVVPIVVEGSFTALPKHALMLRSEQGTIPIKVHVLPPIHPHEVDGDRDRLQARVRGAMAEEIAGLRGVDPGEVA